MLQYLLRFWFPIFGFAFAAGAGIADIGVDGGGGDGAGDGGADGGDAGAGDQGADGADAGGGDPGDSDQSDLDADGAADADHSADPDAPVDLGDGRQVPAKWKKLFDQAAKAGLGQEAKQLYFANKRLLSALPGGVNQAIELARTVEELGGVEGIEQLQADLEVYQNDAQDFASNPSKWVESGFSEDPDAALNAFDHSLQYVSDKFPDHYDFRAAGIIMADLANLDVRGIHQVLAGLKDNPEAQRLAKQLADYYNSRRETSEKAPEQKPDAKDKALTERTKAVEKQEMDLRFKQVNQEVFPTLKSDVTKALQAEAKRSAIDLGKLSKEYPAEWRNMLNEIHQEVMKAAVKDQRFVDKHYALVKKGDLKRAAKAVNDKHAAIVPDIALRVMKTYGVFRGKKAAGDKGKNDKGGNAGAANGAQNAGWLKVSKRPENSAINWSKTTSAMQLDGKYILNDGKKVLVQY